MRAEEQKETAENLFAGNSETSALLRADTDPLCGSYDWSQTPLGASETWSESLKTAVQSRLAELNQAQSLEQVQQVSVPPQNCTQTDALRESEAKYRPLFESIDQGWCICELLFDENGEPHDYRFLEVNEAFERLTGLEQVIGKTARQVVPNHDTHWFDIFGRVVRTREPVRVEQQTSAINRWFDVNAFCIGEPQSNQFAALFTNISETKRIEAERKKVEQERDRFLAVGSDLQVIMSNHGYFHWVSPTSERILGWTPDEMTSRPWTDFLHPDDILASVAESVSVLSGNETFAFENRYRHKDGSYRWLLWRAQPHLEAQVLYAAAVDITARKQAEVALRQSEEHYRRLFESIDEGFCTIEVLFDAEGKPIDHRILQANPACERQSGITNPEGKTVSELAPGLEQYWNDLYAQVINTGESIRTEVRSDALDRWFDVLVSRVGDAAMCQVAIIFTDISDRKRMEIALRENEERFRTLADNMSQFAWMADETGWIFWYNQRWFDYTGTTLEEMQGWGWQQVHHPDHVDRVVEHFRHCLETGEGWEDTFPLRSKDGTYRWFLSRAIPIRDEQGQILRWFGTNTDISDRKQAELEIQKFVSLADNSGEFIGMCDMNFVPFYVNPAGQQLVGLDDVQQYIETSVRDFFFPEDQDFIINEFLPRVLQEGRAELEIRFRHFKTGTALWMIYNVFYIRGENNQPIGLATVSRNITDRKQAEAALQESEELKRRILESSQDCIKVLTLEGQLLYLNTGGLHLLEIDDPASVLNAKWLDFWQDEDRLSAEAALAAAKAGNVGQFQGWYPTMKGNLKCWDVIVTPIRDASGMVAQLLSISRDITKQKQADSEREQLLKREQVAREEAERANRIKDEFLAVLSHELRSPLNPILGWTQLLRNGKLAPARQLDALVTIERNAKLQLQLIEDLLDISRIMQGKLTLTATGVSLAFVIAAAVETVRLAADANNIQITLDLDPDVAPVSGDAARLQQVVWNLLTNAVKFTDSGGQVMVQLSQVAAEGNLGNAMAQIRVIDTGKGISPQFLPHVFEYFRQEDGSTTRRFGGLGLGLAIVRQIVELHGGTVKAESRGEHQGATFIVQLPTLQASLIDLEPTQTQATSETRLQNVKILLVDDDTDTREFEAFLLEQHMATVVAAASGSEALQALDRVLPDVIISDIGMPQIDGYALMQQIRSRPPAQGGTIPAIALTAYAAEIDQKKALQSGYQKHLTKPLEPEQLVNAIVTLLGGAVAVQQ